MRRPARRFAGRFASRRPRTALTGVLIAGATLGTQVSSAPAAAQTMERHAFEEAHMGTRVRVVVHAPDSVVAAEAARAAFRVVSELDGRLSDYRSDSEVSRLSGAGAEPVEVSESLWRVLSAALAWAERTGGSYDPTVGPLTRLWRWSARRGELPDPERLARARAVVGWRGVVLDSAARAVRFERSGMALDLGGIAKGFAADQALAELERRGLPAAMVDAGGDMALGAPPPGEPGWRVALPDGQVVALARAGVATSGDRYRFAEVDGTRYAHVVDARTGLGLVDAPEVTVIARDALTADVLASALGVMEPTAGAELVRSLPGVFVRVRGRHGWEAGARPPPRERPEGNEEP